MAPPYLWEGPSLTGSADGMGGSDKPSPGLKSLRPSLSRSTTSTDILRENNSHHLQPTIPSIPLPVVVFEIANTSFFLSCGLFPKQKPQSQRDDFKKPNGFQVSLPSFELNQLELSC